MEAAIIFDSFLPNALRWALQYAGDDGFVASMPQSLQARANASYDDIIWNSWFTANSEENLAKTPQGNRVVLVVHGGGIYASPERFEKLYRADVDRSDLDQSQTRILFLAGNSGASDTEDADDHPYCYDAKYVISGNASIIGIGR